tara:strand:- start:1016 stop:1558 length:543 start_codon:yes stop_codon:yes gene_type:complete
MTDNELYYLIQDTPAVASQIGDNNAVVASLNEKAQTRTDSTRRDSNWLTNNLTAEEADAILGTLQAATTPRVIAANAMLSGVGIDLSNETVQEMLPQLATAGGWPAGLADTIAAAGVWTESVYEAATTRDAVATIADVEAAFAWYDIDRRLANNYNAARALIDGETVATWAEIEAILVQE